MSNDVPDPNLLDIGNQSMEWPEDSSAILESTLRETKPAEQYFADAQKENTKWKHFTTIRNIGKFCEIVGR